MLLCSRTQEVAGSPLDQRHTGWTHLRGSGSRREAIYDIRAAEAAREEDKEEEKEVD
jgi:hypothetical protein